MLTLPSWFTFAIHIVDFNLGPYCFLSELLAQISLMAPHLLQNSLNSLSRAFNIWFLNISLSCCPWWSFLAELCPPQAADFLNTVSCPGHFHVLVRGVPSCWLMCPSHALWPQQIHSSPGSLPALRNGPISSFLKQSLLICFLNTKHVPICFPVHVLSHFLDDELSETTPEFLYF